MVAPNHLNRQFTPEGPNQSWATDITYIRTHEGWLYLAVVLDLFSREQIQHYGQVQPPFVGADIGDVRGPGLVWPLGCELSIQVIGGHHGWLTATTA